MGTNDHKWQLLASLGKAVDGQNYMSRGDHYCQILSSEGA